MRFRVLHYPCSVCPSVQEVAPGGSLRVHRPFCDVKNRSTESHPHRGALPSPDTTVTISTAAHRQYHKELSLRLALNLEFLVLCLERTMILHLRSPTLPWLNAVH